MICANCGETNADDTAACVKCGGPLGPAANKTVAAGSARGSRKATVSFVLGIVGIIGAGFLWALFFLGALLPFLWGWMYMGGPLSALFLPFPFLSVALCILAIALGARSLKDIRASSGQLRGVASARVGLILGWFSLIVGLALPFVLLQRGSELVPPRLASAHMRSAMRSLQNALEAYYVDFKCYPPWAVGTAGAGGAWSYNYGVASAKGALAPYRSRYYEPKKIGPFSAFKQTFYDSNPPADLPCFALRGRTRGQLFSTVTTPIAYINSYPEDWLSPIRGTTFVYWTAELGKPDPSGKIVAHDRATSAVGWILVSPGPDRKYDIAGDGDVYDLSVPQPSPRLLTGTNKKGHAFTYDPTNGAISHGDIWRVKE